MNATSSRMKTPPLQHLSVVEGGKVAVILAGAQVGAPVVGLQCQRKRVSDFNTIAEFLLEELT